MAVTEHFVIVGASLAGAKAAEALRDEGFDGRVTLIGDEAVRPYERPPLSKDYLLGNAARDKVFVHPEGWYAEHAVDLLLGVTVTGLDAHERKLTLDGGERLPYDKLLLATGSSPRLLDLPGANLAGVLYLRRLEDSERLKLLLAQISRIAIIGAGWIGLEAAAAARAAGVEVTVLESAALPLLRVLGPEVAQVFADLHGDHGVDLRLGVSVEALEGDGSGSVTGVRLADGTTVEAQAVLVGVGIAPMTDLAEGAGLTVDNGILVDEHLRASDPSVFAAGDVANAFHPFLGKHIRVEHWANALNQPAVAARSMLGQAAVYDRLPYFFSDQFDVGMEYTGYVEPGEYDEVVVRGDGPGREFIAFWLASGRVLAGMNVNVWDVTDPIKALITSRRTVEPARLADPTVPLDEV